MTRLFLAGEGKHELGRWANEPPWRDAAGEEDGVLATLYRRFDPSAEVVDGVLWRRIVKYQVGEHRGPEARTLLGAAQYAREKDAVLVWCRDTDHDDERLDDLQRGMKELPEKTSTRWVWCPVIPCLEGWVLDLAGKQKMPDDERVTKLQKLAQEAGLDTLDAMTRVAETAPLERLSSPSLKDWLERARRDVETHREA
ncbi:MAG: hypothetical protein AB1938_06955 [Myxococcota bacterium]